MANQEPMVFEPAAPIQIPVKIGDKNYVLREADEDAAVKYRDATMRGFKLDNYKVVGTTGMAGAEPLLVSLCLFKKEGGRVPESIIRKWSPGVVKALFERIKEISELDEGEEEAEEKAKNGQETGMETSDSPVI